MLNIKKALTQIVHLLVVVVVVVVVVLPFQQAYLTNYSTCKHETLHSYVVPLWVAHRHVKNFVNNVVLVKQTKIAPGHVL